MRFLTTFQKNISVDLKKVLTKRALLKKIFQKQPVDLVFIHGSLAKNKLKPLSDIDVAILFKKDKYTFTTLTEIYHRFCDFFKREDVDIGILNRSSPLFAMQVLKNGIPIYCRKEVLLKNFRLKTIQHYLSTKHLRDTFYNHMETAILRSA